MFVHWSWTNRNIVEIHIWVVWLHFFFLLNIISYACLLRSELKLVFHWKAQLFINFKSLLISPAKVLMSWTMENKEVSSANNLHWLLRPFGKSLTYIKNKRGPRMEPCGTPARISTQKEHWSFKTILCFLLVKKSFSSWKSVQHARLYQRLSKCQGTTLKRQRLYRRHLKFHDRWQAVD